MSPTPTSSSAVGGTVAAPATRPPSGRGEQARTAPRAWPRRLLVTAAILAAVVLAVLITAAWVDRTGLAFFDRGGAS